MARITAQASRFAYAPCQNRALSTPGKNTAMDIERINQIGSTLSDLAARTEALRGYL
jgi:phospholipase/lecithinase/hemolysin